MKINVVKDYKIPLTFRTSKVASMFDVPVNEKFSKQWEVNLPLDVRDWQIGLIVGHSGSGKTTIAKEIYGKDAFVEHFEWDNSKSILDNFDAELNADEITGLLSCVGFSSPPHWMLPYGALSNGQKFRVNLARALLSKRDEIVFDEFTSLVDRDIAKISCAAVSKAIRKSKKKFIAVTCHDDVEEWLCPDWTYNVSSNLFEWRAPRRHPEIKIDVFEVDTKAWPLFRDYHYLSADINKSAKCHVALWNDNPVGFLASLHMPHPKAKNIKTGHRAVVLPDFQGVGIGNRLLDFIAQTYLDKGYRYRSATSHPAMIGYRAKSKKWKMTSKPGLRQPFGKTSSAWSTKTKENGLDRMIATFEYVG